MQECMLHNICLADDPLWMSAKRWLLGGGWGGTTAQHLAFQGQAATAMRVQVREGAGGHITIDGVCRKPGGHSIACAGVLQGRLGP